ncbi:MAG: hypothetical protein ABIH23_19480 [bacterium]
MYRLPFLILSLVILPIIGAAEALPPDAKPLRITISREHPLIIFQGRVIRHSEPALIINDWKQHVPDDLKPYCVFEIEVRDLDLERRYSTYIAVLDRLQEANIPVCLQVIDPHPEYALPLRFVEKLLDRYDCIQVVQSTENRTEFYTKVPEAADLATPVEISYMVKLIKMGAQRGIPTSMQHQALRWLHIGTDELARELRETLSTYHAYVLPQNEHLGNQHFPRQTSVWGFWMGDVVDHWGIEAQSWWWENAHFIKPGVFGLSPMDWQTTFPKGIYRPMILQAAMLGATVYGFEPNWDLFEYARPDVWYDNILPTLREVIYRGLISSKEEVLEKTKLAYQVPFSKSIADFHRISRDMDWMADEGFLARAAYGVYARGIEHELIPNRNRAFFIPILPLNAKESAIRRFHRVISPGECNSVEEYEEMLEQFYPEPDREPAYVQQVGRFIHVMQTHENLYERQEFSVPVPIAVHEINMNREDKDTVSLCWPPVKGAKGYQVCRWINDRSAPEEFPIGADWSRWEIIAEVADSSVQLKITEDVILGVRAKTTERETLNSTVNFLDCLVFDTTCSPIVEIVEITPDTKQAVSRARRFQDTRPEKQEWFDLGIGLTDEKRKVAEEVRKAFRELISYFEKEDIKGLASFYAQDYRDPNGYDRDYALRAWLWWFQRMQFPFCAATIQEWDTSKYERDGIIRMKLVGFWRGVIMWDEPWGYDGLARFPRHENAAVWWNWKKNPKRDSWEIITTDPACPNFGEMLWNSRDHTYLHGMEDFRDGLKPW